LKTPVIVERAPSEPNLDDRDADYGQRSNNHNADSLISICRVSAQDNRVLDIHVQKSRSPSPAAMDRMLAQGPVENLNRVRELVDTHGADRLPLCAQRLLAHDRQARHAEHQENGLSARARARP
jgi:hypothetical protein